MTTQPHYSPTAHCTVGDPSYVSDVTGKQLKYRPKIPQWKRFEVIRERYGSCSKTELALFAGVSVRQIDRDLSIWFNTVEYRQYVRDRVHEYLDPKNDKIPEWKKFDAWVSIYRDLLNGSRVNDDVQENKNVLERVECERILKAYGADVKT